MDCQSKQQHRVLIVAADLTPCVSVEVALESFAAEIKRCHTGEHALQLTEQYDFSLIYIDVLVTDISAYRLVSKIHGSLYNGDSPVVLMYPTPPSDAEQLKGYKAGAIDATSPAISSSILHAKARIFLEYDTRRRVIQKQSGELNHAFKKLQHFATHDQLTKLFNREQITNILVRLMANARRSKKLIAIIFLDLDHFKTINDSLGHEVGDLLLMSVSERMKRLVREGDFISRMGGDEFAVILNGIHCAEDAGEITQKMLEQLGLPQFIRQYEVHTSCSAGIALYDNYRLSAGDLLKSADAAMYLAKNKGRNQYAYFSQELEHQASRKMQIVQGLNDAIERNELSIHYQPQFSAVHRKLVGFEALMRWQQGQQHISPSTFIPIAEESGQIPRLGEWVLRQSCLALKRWQAQGKVEPEVKMAVNVSYRQIQTDNFLKVLKRILDETQIAPHCLELELTESTVMSEPESAINLFREIHKLGVEIAVDDFGTGYSSLSYLSQFPIDTIKIDQSFVKDIAQEQNDDTIVKAIISLSHSLGLNVVAEGVENDTQRRFLSDNRCDYVQGFLFSKPLKSEDVPPFLSRYKSSLAS